MGWQERVRFLSKKKTGCFIILVDVKLDLFCLKKKRCTEIYFITFVCY